ncbi:MAG: hypothetical protein IJH87_04120, partial [Atopobiaceae bacterium]|nr:hypothetical protein [Atopobiaceae bacterium]
MDPTIEKEAEEVEEMHGEKETVTGKVGDQRAIGTRFQDILFIGLVFCLLFAVIANAVYARLSPQYRLNRFSFFEQRNLAEKPGLSVGTVLSGKAQEGIEQYVADAVPWRDGLLLFSGRLQRLGIESANLLFGYEAYPAVYGSHILMVPGRRTLVELPENTDSGVKERLHTGAACINRLVEAHPEVDWVYVFIDPSSTSVANPAFHLGNDYADHAFYWEHFAGL